MSFNEEVTRHSVHTLVFRSLKRTHDMFLSDQGSLPAGDKDSEKLWKNVKARSMYGPILDKVESEKSRGTFGQNTALAIENKSGNQVALYNDPKTGMPAGGGGQNGSGGSLATTGGQLVVFDVARRAPLLRARVDAVRALAAGDLDGNGLDDLVVAAGKRIAVFRSVQPPPP